jgi:capsular polysaccharide biosynthesis protein
MRSFLDENLNLAEFKNRLESSIKRDNKRFIVIVSVLSVLVAAVVTLLVIKAVRSKRMDD